ncbi:hypothetical protein OSH11_11950 [Kaistia dalseonensis]|uniref:Uncharacterized protein n=1 Tax=Kaistia dalseonensis TaxID=410840 RepID=A0ABU0H7L2_9HYPH|nr:hypothetical protein [Kaistia dalseonensis]MCX5495422.1 hypothetical protein [Kaistia dalseonensis]MDQ0438012.1 hypothetical protein [Kaistia dalseonensis]
MADDMSTDQKSAWKRDDRPSRHGWAPGDYLSQCRRCAIAFLGAKRAWTCADCAYAEPDAAPECPICGASDSRALEPDPRIAELEARAEKAEAERDRLAGPTEAINATLDRLAAEYAVAAVDATPAHLERCVAQLRNIMLMTAVVLAQPYKKSAEAAEADLALPALLKSIDALLDAITYDDSGSMGRGGNGGLISRETIRKCDELRLARLPFSSSAG